MFSLTPIGHVRSSRTAPTDDDWDDVDAVVELDRDGFTPDVLAGLEAFSHIEVIFVFDQVDETSVHLGSRHPRGRADWPLVGVFAQRNKARPNRLGVTTCELLGVSDLTIRVRGLDAIDGTPVVDIKPYVVEFGPRGEIRQPDWMTELMSGYW